jgi:hypothetical protein
VRYCVHAHLLDESRVAQRLDGRPSEGEPAFPLDFNGIRVLSEGQGAAGLMLPPEPGSGSAGLPPKPVAARKASS